MSSPKIKLKNSKGVESLGRNVLGPMCSVNGGGDIPAAFVDVHVLVACVCCAVCGSELFA